MRRAAWRSFAAVVLLVSAPVHRAWGQTPSPHDARGTGQLMAPASGQSRPLEIGGYLLVGSTNFRAADTFQAIFGSARGPTVGGGVTLGLPWGGLFLDVGAWRFAGDGQRVFISAGQVFALGIPVRVTVTPIELTGGWKFRGLSERFIPYLGGGYSSYAYKESSDFSSAGEDVSERFSGYHLLGGGEFTLTRWLGLAGEAEWATVPDAIGDAGASGALGDTNLGGAGVRLKVTVGR